MWYFCVRGPVARHPSMYTTKFKYLRAFLKCLLVASSLVLFGNRLTDRFHLCTSFYGGLYRVQHNGQHWYRGHTDLGVQFGKVLSSVSKRYHSPVGLVTVAPSLCIRPVAVPAVRAGYVLPMRPDDSGISCPFLRGPPSCS
ncbi:MAG TPA: hypothetical protein VHE34_30625 [Puia sp.]|uniref:hypothetical protein n=1 Tax=Puia sp. TaxID=2045100 RepID=UPI002CD294AD|nr:hypothetical protein [Puia sp.]HVU99630.1 hypothetical protein [Puia sp.]